MRVAVVTSSPPLSDGGHLVIAQALVTALTKAGHRAGLITTPQNRFGRQGAAYVATWLTDVGVTDEGDAIDQVISLRYPSYAVRHPRHVCWLNHTMREYYDLWDQFRAPLSWKGRLKEGVRRRLVHLADRRLLTHHVGRVFAQSTTIRDRLRQDLGLEAAVLRPPPPPRPYRCDDYGDYVFAVSRLTPLKRLHLVVAAVARGRTRGLRCVIAGDGPEIASLRALVRELRVEDRVELVGRVSDSDLVEHLARCRAVCFVPRDEDYGFVTTEAFASRKAVITCTDSGGPAELVQDGVQGFVCRPEAETLATAMARLMEDRDLAVRMGNAGHAIVAEMSWEHAVGELLV